MISFQMVSDTGEEKQDICPEENFYPMFFRPWYVKMDPSGNYSYVSDCHRGHVTCISGSILRRFVYKVSNENNRNEIHGRTRLALFRLTKPIFNQTNQKLLYFQIVKFENKTKEKWRTRLRTFLKQFTTKSRPIPTLNLLKQCGKRRKCW